MTASAETIAELKQRLRKVEIDDHTYYVAEGDLLLTDDQLERYADGGQAHVPPPRRPMRDELIAIAKDGKIVRWRPGLVLDYTIVKATFTTEEYATVRANIKQATVDWQRTCGISFSHQIALDDAGATDGVLFTVRKVDTGGRFIAAAFFPDEPKFRRQVMIDPSYFTTAFDRVGVLRHELGHVLGFRHEHIRSEAPAVCPNEDLAGTIDLNEYDPQSVMHYFCGGVGSRDLRISEKDIIASQRLYGPPLDKVEYVE